MTALFLTALLIIFVICSLLILWCKYDDGLIGKAALTCCVFGAGVPIWEIGISGIDYEILPSTLLLTCGFAAFLVRHLYRFIRWRLNGTFSWQKLLG